MVESVARNYYSPAAPAASTCLWWSPFNIIRVDCGGEKIRQGGEERIKALRKLRVTVTAEHVTVGREGVKEVDTSKRKPRQRVTLKCRSATSRRLE